MPAFSGSIQAAAMLPVRDTILNKVYGVRRGEQPEIKTGADPITAMKPEKVDSNKSFRRRAAVFDHHDVHPDWAGKDGTVPVANTEPAPVQRFIEERRPAADGRQHKIHHFGSMRLPETSNRGASPAHLALGQINGDLAKSASIKSDRIASYSKMRDGNHQTQSAGPASPNCPRNAGLVAMSGVNQMRTERLANALKVSLDHHFLTLAYPWVVLGFGEERIGPVDRHIHADAVDEGSSGQTPRGFDNQESQCPTCLGPATGK